MDCVKGCIATAVAHGPWGPVRIAAGARGVVAVELLGTAEGFEAGLARRRLGPPSPSAARGAVAVAVVAARAHRASCAAAGLCARTRDLVTVALRG